MEEEMFKLCKCGHTRDAHDNSSSEFKDGGGPQKGKKDSKCKATNPDKCPCEEYIPEEK